MIRNEIFARRLAREVAAHELDEVRGGINVAGTFRPNTCAAGGGWDGEIIVDGPIYN